MVLSKAELGSARWKGNNVNIGSAVRTHAFIDQGIVGRGSGQDPDKACSRS